MMPATLSSNPPPIVDWTGRRVTLLGLGRHGGGLGAARYLASRGARLTISDAATAEVLAPSLNALSDVPIEAVHLGGHEFEDFTAAEFVVVNPAIRPDHPALHAARSAGATITSEIELFLERCPARVIGVSGSNGKTTTATMLFEILRAAGATAWLGGNIGGSLLGELDHISTSDWVVLELSSFQLAHLSLAARLPEIAVLTNVTPNHLDWHDTLEGYASAKRRLLACYQVVLNHHDPELGRWRTDIADSVSSTWSLAQLPQLAVPGQHNRQNAACAAAAAELAGVDLDSIRHGLAEFRGLDHRIQYVGRFADRCFFNDSKSTSPAATMAAMQSIDGPFWLLAGGVSKGTDFAELSTAILAHARGVALFGQSAAEIAEAIRHRQPDFRVAVLNTLEQALQWSVTRSSPGEAILLSPACASFDQYADYADRGRQFCRLVRQTSG